MASEVLFLKIDNNKKVDQKKTSERVFQTFADFFVPQDKIAIKIHFGEPKNTTAINPEFVKGIWKRLVLSVKDIALVDCNVLYKGKRTNKASHEKLAITKGFDFAPIDILDGQIGECENEIPVKPANGFIAKHFKTAKIGKGLEKYGSILAISHFKGHSACGFGGTIKNIGMGFGSRAGKMAMHKAFHLEVNAKKCLGCGLCQKECPNNAIIIENNIAKIVYEKCLGCAKCLALCPNNAFIIPWQAGVESIQEKIGEYALAALTGKKAIFVNVLLDITKRCDCVNESQIPFLQNIGILISKNPVAIDQASLDMAGKENFTQNNSINPQIQIDYGEKIGLGQKSYTLKYV